MDIKKYTLEDRQEWNNFVKNSKNGFFMFNRDFMDYHSDRFQDYSLMFYNHEELMAILPASLHGNELQSHGGLTYGGFICNEKMKQHHMIDCFEALKAYMRENNLLKIVYKVIPHIYHKQPSEEDLYALYKTGAKLLKIEPSTTVLLKNPLKMPKGRKAQIARAKRENVIIKESDDFENFIKLENLILSKFHNSKAVHTAEELNILKLRFKDKIQLWIAEYEGKIIAGILLFVYDNVVHTQYMAANDLAREIGGLDLLIKTLMEKYADTKTYFDFGISSEYNGCYLNEGLIAQKEGFGGRTSIYQTWEINTARLNGEKNEF